MHRKKINVSTVLAGQELGIKEVDNGIWLVSFMRYEPGYFDLEQRILQTFDNPSGTIHVRVAFTARNSAWDPPMSNDVTFCPMKRS